MGGRGSASKTATSGGSSGKSAKGSGSSKGSLANANTKFTNKQLSGMNRRQLTTAAKAVFVKTNMARGLSESEAMRRFDSLVSGNSDAYLRKYIKKYG